MNLSSCFKEVHLFWRVDQHTKALDYNFNSSVLFDITESSYVFTCTKLQLNHYKCVITNIFKYMTKCL